MSQSKGNAHQQASPHRGRSQWKARLEALPGEEAPESVRKHDLFNRLSVVRQRDLARDLEDLRKLAADPDRTAVKVRAAAMRMRCHPSTIYRRLHKLGPCTGTVKILLPEKVGFPKGVSRLHPRQVEIIIHWLDKHYLQPAKPPLVETTKLIGDQCEGEGFTRPGRSAVIRRRDLIDPAILAGRREGAKEAQKFKPKPGQLCVELPRDLYQVDHTLIDVVVIDRDGVPIGRAWLTIVLDVCTRMIVGFVVGLDPPSILRTGSALDLAVSEKTEWLAARGLSYEWPCYGLCKVVHTDNGSDFRADVIMMALLSHGITPKFRPLGRPHWGGHVERLIGTLMGKCRVLPGATHRSPKARGEYDSAGSARLRVEDLQAWMTHQILGVYHNTPHSGLGGLTPLEAWKTKAAGLDPILPDDMRAFRIDLLPESRRTLTPQGVKLHRQEYFDARLFEALRIGSKVRVKFDPRDLRSIYVLLPAGWTEVSLRFPGNQPPPLWLRPNGLRETLARGGEGRAVAADANAAALAIVASAPASSKRRRQAERLRHDAASAAELRNRLNADEEGSGLDVDDDSDWGGAFQEGDQ